VGWDPTEPIRAVVPVGLADDLDVIPGADISGFVAGAPVAFRMVGTTDGVPGAATAGDLASLAAGLPSSSRGGSTIVVDGRALVHRLVQASAYGPLVDEHWLSASASDNEVTAGGHAPAAETTDRAHFVDATAFGRRMMDAPLRAEIPAAAAVAVWASVLLALAGFGARVASVIRSRRLESAQLRAIGLSRRGMMGVATLDAVGTALTGSVIGLGAGWATLAWIGTRIVVVASGADVQLVVPWQALILVPLAILGALGLVSFGIAVGQRRLPLPQLLRAGGDG
jgi:hypothetical protein